MCGITGIISPNIDAKLLASMQAMLKVQEHRGPDHSDYIQLDNQVIFGHNRLSIIDLSEAADQPFFSNDQRYAMVFNGEIYNYIELKEQLKPFYNFKTSSDTEVLLAAYIHWGEAALDKLIGMFSIVIYDKEQKELFIARDRFGVKPFNYAFDTAGNLVFASEIKTLHAAGIPKKQNTALWAAYLTKGRYQYKNQTFWEGIYQLEAGHCAKFSINDIPQDLNTKRWYHFVDHIHALQKDTEYLNRSKEEHLLHYKSLLEDSIKLRFRSDVTVGFNISGGLDSSTLLGAVHQLHPKEAIEAFTFYCGDDRYDELPWVEKLISETNKPLNNILLAVEEVPTQSQQVSYFQDEPYGGIPTIAYSQIFKAARAKGVIVLLDGQGMDEAWAGYDYYHKNSDSVVQGVKTSPFKPEVLTQEFKSEAVIEDYPTPFKDSLLNKQYRDLFYTKIPRALRFNDRVSMMHSTELREPFLDHRLVEYAFALPTSLKTQNGQVKWALRELATQYLNSDILLAPKRPLQTPQREWLTEDLITWVEKNIKDLEDHPWINKSALQEAWHTFKQSDKDNTFFLWQWLSVIAHNKTSHP